MDMDDSGYEYREKARVLVQRNTGQNTNGHELLLVTRFAVYLREGPQQYYVRQP